MADFTNIPEYLESVIQKALDKVSAATIADGIHFKKTQKDETALNPAVFISVDRALSEPQYDSDDGSYGIKQGKQYVALYADISIPELDTEQQQLLKTEANRVEHLLEMAVENIEAESYTIDNSAFGFLKEKIDVTSVAVIDRIPAYEDHQTNGRVIVIAEILYMKTYL